MATSPRHPSSRRRDQRGVAFPSPLVMLSVVAIAMAGIAFVATQDRPATERRVEIAAATPTDTPTETPEPTQTEPEAPRVDRGKVNVEVYNNSGVKGLAGQTAQLATQAGWAVVGEDNWYGQIPASTVYFPAGMKAAGKQLALDLGIGRVAPSVDPMRMDRLTVVLTADAAG